MSEPSRRSRRLLIAVLGATSLLSVVGCSSESASVDPTPLPSVPSETTTTDAPTTTAGSTTTTVETTTTESTTTSTTSTTTTPPTPIGPSLAVGDTLEIREWFETVLEATVVDVVDRPDGEGALAALVVDDVLELVECVVVIDASTDPGTRLDGESDDRGLWIEGCSFPDEPPFDRVFRVDDSTWTYAAAERVLIAIDGDQAVTANGCVGPLAEVLDAVDDLIGPGMVSAIACGASVDDANLDAVVNLARPSVLLSPGPVDGLLLILERDADGSLDLADLGTGIDPEPDPQSIRSGDLTP